MKKTYTLTKDRETNNFAVYKSYVINGMYIRKSELPHPTPDEIEVKVGGEDNDQ